MGVFLITLKSCKLTEPLAEMVIDPETKKQIPRFFLETAGVRTCRKQLVSSKALLFFCIKLIKVTHMDVELNTPELYAEAQLEPGLLQTYLKNWFAAARKYGFPYSCTKDFNEPGMFILVLVNTIVFENIIV